MTSLERARVTGPHPGGLILRRLLEVTVAARRKPWYQRIPSTRTLASATLSSGMAGAAGVVSYVNVRATILMGHQHELVADCLAAIPDITMGLTLLKLSERRAGTQRVTPWAWIGYGLGLAASLAGNEVSEWHNGWIGRVSGAVLPLFVTVCVELARHAGRPARRAQRRPGGASQRQESKAPGRRARQPRAEVVTA